MPIHRPRTQREIRSALDRRDARIGRTPQGRAQAKRRQVKVQRINAANRRYGQPQLIIKPDATYKAKDRRLAQGERLTAVVRRRNAIRKPGPTRASAQRTKKTAAIQKAGPTMKSAHRKRANMAQAVANMRGTAPKLYKSGVGPVKQLAKKGMTKRITKIRKQQTRGRDSGMPF